MYILIQNLVLVADQCTRCGWSWIGNM